MNTKPHLNDDCLFCKIIKGEIPSDVVYDDDFVYAFRDINPQAPTHVLVIPKTHIPSCAAVNADNAEILGPVFAAIAEVSKKENLSEGFRVISNTGKAAGQTVEHLHFHVLGGKDLSEKLIP